MSVLVDENSPNPFPLEEFVSMDVTVVENISQNEKLMKTMMTMMNLMMEFSIGGHSVPYSVLINDVFLDRMMNENVDASYLHPMRTEIVHFE